MLVKTLLFITIQLLVYFAAASGNWDTSGNWVYHVCKRWHAIGEEGWNDIKELDIMSEYSENITHLILKRCGRFLRKLKIDELMIEHPHSLSMVIEFCQLDRLEEIEIEIPLNENRNVDVDLSDLREIFEKSGKLVVVRISGYFVVSGPEYLNFLNPDTLRKLQLCNFRKNLPINPDRFPNLNELFLRNVTIIEDEMIRTEESLKDLEKATFHFCHLSENFIQRIWTFQNLQVLGLGTLDDANIINNEHIRHIAEYCGKLKEISLFCLSNVTSDCFKYLGNIPSLEVFNFGPFDKVKSHDVAYLTNVKTLSFGCCENIVVDAGFIELIVNSSNLEKLTLVNMGLMRSFLDDIERIFQLGQRKKHLIFILKQADCSCDIEEIISPCTYCPGDGSYLKKVTYHPLLDSRVDSEFLVSDDDLVE